MTESHEDQLRHYRRERALWSLEEIMTGCLERGDKEQIEAVTKRQNAELRALHPQHYGTSISNVKSVCEYSMFVIMIGQT